MSKNSGTKTKELQKHLSDWAQDHPVSHWGATTLERPLTIDFYKDWIKGGRHASMKYLKDQMRAKENPTSWLGPSRIPLASAFVFAFPYLPHPEGGDFPLKSLKVAAYARGQDYHHWIKRHLNQLVETLKLSFPEQEFHVFTDSAPILERDLAYRSGLGWFGKNTCLIDRKHGSFFLIGEIYTSLKLEQTAELSHDFCGTCRACLDSCPTGALKEPKVLDSNLCISYWTIESRQIAPENLRKQFNGWFFGCDICQTVCPWNQKIIKGRIDPIQGTADHRQDLVEETRFILKSSGKALERTFKGTPFLRAGPFGLKRNALYVSAHYKLVEVRPEINLLKSHQRLGELAEWVLAEIV